MFCGVNMKRQLLCQLELGPNASVKTLFKGNISITRAGPVRRCYAVLATLEA